MTTYINNNKILKDLELFRTVFKDIHVYYAVKCDNNPQILELLYQHHVCFDCASINEIRTIRQIIQETQVNDNYLRYTLKNSVIHANPHRQLNSLSEAYNNLHIRYFTVDSEYELLQFKQLQLNNAKILLRLEPYQHFCQQTVDLGIKYGCGQHEATRLLLIAQQQNINISGFCFHLGYPCGAPADFLAMFDIIEQYVQKFKINMEIIDIGGGFVNDQVDYSFKINDYKCVYDRFLKMRQNYMQLQLFAEPGRFLVEDAIFIKFKIDRIQDQQIFIEGSCIYYFYRNILYNQQLNGVLVESDQQCQFDLQHNQQFTMIGNSGLQRDAITVNLTQCADTPKFVILQCCGSYTLSFQNSQFKDFCGQ